jgi:hypothetical protein
LGPVQSDPDILLINEEDLSDNILCVTRLSCRSPSNSDSVSNYFDSQLSIDDGDLGFFVEMDDKSSKEDLDFLS